MCSVWSEASANPLRFPHPPTPLIPHGNGSVPSPGLQDAAHSVAGHPQLPRQRPHRPVPGVRGRRRHRQAVGLDMPVRRMVSASPRPGPGSRTMRARKARFRGLRGLPMTSPGRSRSPSESPVLCGADFPPIRLSPVSAVSAGRLTAVGSTISWLGENWNLLYRTRAC